MSLLYVGREVKESLRADRAWGLLTHECSGSYDWSVMPVALSVPKVSGRMAMANTHNTVVSAEGEMTRSALKFAATALVLGVSLFSSATVFAQEETRSSDGEGGGYGYEFTDDPLNAGGFGPNDATIRVRPGPVRTTLIRPRTSFVNEMLKSVENL